jgi:hypothetical protein
VPLRLVGSEMCIRDRCDAYPFEAKSWQLCDIK